MYVWLFGRCESETKLYWTSQLLCLSYVRHTVASYPRRVPSNAWRGVSSTTCCSSMPFQLSPGILSLSFSLSASSVFFPLLCHLLLRMRSQIGSHPSGTGVIWWEKPIYHLQLLPARLITSRHLPNVSSLDQQETSSSLHCQGQCYEHW